MFNSLEPSGKYVPPGSALKILQFAHKVYLCVLYGSCNKQDFLVDRSDQIHPSQ